MNPCACGVASKKILGFIIYKKGIEVDQAKIKAIRDMPSAKNLKEARGLQGSLAYVRRFILNLVGPLKPFEPPHEEGSTFQMG